MPGSTSGDNPFEGRVAVKIVSISDLLLAATLLCYYGYKWMVYDPKADLIKNSNSLESVIRSQFLFMWIAVMILHSLQFVMSLVLLSSAYDRDAEDALGKCQMWWCTATLIFWVLGVEAVGMVYMMVATQGIQPIAMAMFILKFIYRLTAVVNVRSFMKNLKKAPPTSVHQMVYIRSKAIGPLGVPPSNYASSNGIF